MLSSLFAMTHIFGYYSGKHATISEKVITSAAAVL
jgi:hypothetical protein